MAGIPLGSFPPHPEVPSAKRKRRSHSRASQEAFIDLGSGDDTDSTVMEEGQTPRASSASSSAAAVADPTCSTVVAPNLAQAPPPVAAAAPQTSTAVLPGKNSALVSVHINAVGFMQQHFKDLLDNKKYVDVTFVLEGQPIPAHRLILASQSDYFDRLFYGKVKEATSSDEIPLPNVPLEAFRLLLEFMYSGCLDYDNQPLQVVLDLLSLADRYMIGMLKEALSHQLCEHIDQDSVLPILLHASLHNVSLLREKCLQFVDHHGKVVLSGPSFLPLPKECVLAILSRDSLYVPEEEIFQAVTRWMEHNHHNKEDIKDIIACVRLSEISPSVLFALVEPSGFFDGQYILDALRIQMKPELLEMRSRGRLEVDRNLLRECILCPASTGLYPRIESLLSMKQGGSPTLADQVIYLGSVPHKSDGHERDSGHTHHQPSSCTLDLGDNYLVNYVELQGYPTASHLDRCRLCFLYTLKVSRDKVHWHKLFDYSVFKCCGNQHLCFPQQVVRYVQFDLIGRSNTSAQFALNFVSCRYANSLKPFALRSHGVIAPLVPITPLCTISSSDVSANKGYQACLIAFNQPYSISQLRFKVNERELKEGTWKGDISVLVGTRRETTNMSYVANLPQRELGTEVSARFRERVVCYVLVILKNPSSKDQSEVQNGTGEPQPSSQSLPTSQPSQVLSSSSNGTKAPPPAIIVSDVSCYASGTSLEDSVPA